MGRENWDDFVERIDNTEKALFFVDAVARKFQARGHHRVMHARTIWSEE